MEHYLIYKLLYSELPFGVVFFESQIYYSAQLQFVVEREQSNLSDNTANHDADCCRKRAQQTNFSTKLIMQKVQVGLKA